jgi:hypothetical protein
MWLGAGPIEHKGREFERGGKIRYRRMEDEN